jgi:signal transduction histidine kinase
MGKEDMQSVLEVVKAHGGSIWCESAESGAGTVVAFWLKADG